MKRAFRVATLLMLALGVGLHATPAVATNTASCTESVVREPAAVKKKRIGQLSRCLKFGNYDSCELDGLRISAEENALRHKVAGENSACAAAVNDDGAAVSDFGPLSCASEWNDCDVVVPAINTLDDLAECLVCQQLGYDIKIRDTLGWPRPAPTDRDELGCTRTLGVSTAWAVRKAAIDTLRCSSGGAKPFNCPADDSPGTGLGRAIDNIERRAATCRIDEGEAPGALANLCGGNAVNQDQLIACFTSLARCLACRTANSLLEQSQDCVAFSGDASCTGSF